MAEHLGERARAARHPVGRDHPSFLHPDVGYQLVAGVLRLCNYWGQVGFSSLEHHKIPQPELEDFVVTPRRTVMNFYEKAGELLPLVMAWNSDVAAFLKREPTPQTLAVTYLAGVG